MSGWTPRGKLILIMSICRCGIKYYRHVGRDVRRAVSVPEIAMHKSRLDAITSSLKRAKQPRYNLLEERLFEAAKLYIITLGFLFLVKNPFE